MTTTSHSAGDPGDDGRATDRPEPERCDSDRHDSDRHAADRQEAEGHGGDPLTDGERRRVGALLSTVTSRTLLRSLVGLCHMSGDAQLIIAELVSRLPPDAADPPDPGGGGGQAPVMPM